MAFAAYPHKNGSGMTRRCSGEARLDSRRGSLKSTTKPAVRLDKTPGSTDSTTKPVPPSSRASPPMHLKSGSPSSSINSGGRRNSTASSKDGSYSGGVPGRVRVTVRLRPRNAEEKVADEDFAECVELQPEMKRLQLRKNNWDCDNYQFDEVLTATSSQKRVYEVVAKPVVESVCEGYNGTVMAYGQSGTGKTFTLGCLGEEDTADRGIMVRALEDIQSNVTSADDTLTVSYLQLYKETVQDLLAPENDNIAIVEDPKTGDVSVPRARQVELKDQQSFVRLLQTGEANRFAANTKLNTESSRSHAILLVTLKKVAKPSFGSESGDSEQFAKGTRGANTVRKSKLLIVDLAGSERVEKSGSEGRIFEEAKSINLSLTTLGKCINAIAENSPHVPVRDSKLTRMLRDSFGGTARTSLIVTIGPSPRNRGETASTIAFGQRAMKVENLLRLKEEFDYRSRCRELETEVDRLMAENERQSKAEQDTRENFERRLKETQKAADALEDRLASAFKITETKEKGLKEKHADMVDKLKKQEKELKDTAESYQHEIKERTLFEKKQQQEIAETNRRLESERAERERLGKELRDSFQSVLQKELLGETLEVQELNTKLKKETQLRVKLEEEVRSFQLSLGKLQSTTETNHDEEILVMKRMLQEECKQREILGEKVRRLKDQLMVIGDDKNESKIFARRIESTTRIFEQVGLLKVLSLLGSEDFDVRAYNVKVVANLAVEESNHAKIVEAGGLGSLFLLLHSSEDDIIRSLAACAVANLAKSKSIQELIMAQGGIGLLARTANDAEDPQTLRMVAGAIGNLCDNEKLHVKLREEGGIRALLGMVRSSHPDILAEVAQGVANVAVCESSGAAQGSKSGKSLLIDDGALPWIIANAKHDVSQVRHDIELALCHLARHEVNSNDLVAGGALSELMRISRECSSEAIREDLQQTLNTSSTFQTELKRLKLV